MVRLSELSPAEREHIMGKELPVYDTTPWIEGPPLCDPAPAECSGVVDPVLDDAVRALPAN